MRITLLTVGQTEKNWTKEGLDTYVSRIRHYIPFSVNEIPELKNVSALDREQIKKKEGEMIMKAVKEGDEVILLDEHGKEYSSMEWAGVLERKLSSSGRDIVFIIGGAYGFSQEVYARCNGKISLSKMTFPHQMVRVIFAEQLYRALTIMKGQPYHHA